MQANNPAAPTVVPSTSGGYGRAYFIIHPGWRNLLKLVVVCSSRQVNEQRGNSSTKLRQYREPIQIRGPVEPGLVHSPAVNLAFLDWLRSLEADMVRIPTVEPQMISSILGASEKWSVIPATYMIHLDGMPMRWNMLIRGAAAFIP